MNFIAHTNLNLNRLLIMKIRQYFDHTQNGHIWMVAWFQYCWDRKADKSRSRNVEQYRVQTYNDGFPEAWVGCSWAGRICYLLIPQLETWLYMPRLRYICCHITPPLGENKVKHENTCGLCSLTINASTQEENSRTHLNIWTRTINHYTNSWSFILPDDWNLQPLN